jgi:nucleoside-diphosphate-sugar epimerase
MPPTQPQFKNKRIAIFGAGWLGTEIAKEALRMGMEVTTLTRNPETSARLRDFGVKNPLAAKLTASEWHGEVPREQDFVVNCVSSSGNGLEGYRESYVLGNRSILEWAGKTHLASFVYTGSTSVYTQTDGSTVDESSPTPDPSPSGAILLEAEALLEGHSPFRSTNVLRLGGLYGPGRHYLLNQLREGSGELAGRGDLLLNLLHLEDAVSAVFAALANGLEGFQKFNATDGNPSTKQEIVSWMAGKLGMPTPTFNPDATTARSPIRQSRGTIPSRIVSNKKLREELRWEPKYPSFREGYEALL